MQINPMFLLDVVKMLYQKFRPMLKAAVDDPDQEWDDMLMLVLDRILNYKEE